MNEENKYKHGLKAPENYFDDFEDRLFIRIAEEKLPDTPGFSVPNDYFDTVEEAIMQRWEDEKQVKVIPLYKRKAFAYVASIAACAILVFAIFTKGSPDTMNLELADIEAYMEAGAVDYNSYDIAQLLSEEDLETLPLEDEYLSEENLEAYLLEYLDDTNLLIE